MTKQPEALRLADCLDELDHLFSHPPGMCAEAAAELRRLHEVNQELLEALNAILATNPQHGMNPNAKVSDPMEVKVGWNVHQIARAAIAKATGEAV